MTSRRYGYRRSPAGFDGFVKFARMPRLAHAPALIDNSNLVASVLDQGGLGSCELNGWAQAIRAEELVQLATALAASSGGSFDGALRTVLSEQCPELVSRLYLYFASQACGGYAGQGDTGTCSADVMSALAQFGYCRESADPYVDDVAKIDPGNLLEQLKRLAFDQRCSTTARVDSDAMSADECDVAFASALSGRYLIPFAIEVDQAFEDLQPGQIWIGPRGRALGGHCTTIVGRGPANKLSRYATSSEIVYKVVNSWGSEWCDGGFYLMSVGALAQRWDGCIITRTPEFTGTV